MLVIVTLKTSKMNEAINLVREASTTTDAISLAAREYWDEGLESISAKRVPVETTGSGIIAQTKIPKYTPTILYNEPTSLLLAPVLVFTVLEPTVKETTVSVMCVPLGITLDSISESIPYIVAKRTVSVVDSDYTFRMTIPSVKKGDTVYVFTSDSDITAALITN